MKNRVSVITLQINLLDNTKTVQISREQDGYEFYLNITNLSYKRLAKVLNNCDKMLHGILYTADSIMIDYQL